MGPAHALKHTADLRAYLDGLTAEESRCVHAVIKGYEVEFQRKIAIQITPGKPRKHKPGIQSRLVVRNRGAVPLEELSKSYEESAASVSEKITERERAKKAELRQLKRENERLKVLQLKINAEERIRERKLQDLSDAKARNSSKRAKRGDDGDGSRCEGNSNS